MLPENVEVSVRKIAVAGSLIFLCFWTLLLFAQRIDFSTADLGRHIKNGELLVHGAAEERNGVLYENFYSATEPSYPFVNHHWFSGILFYLVHELGGFSGLSVFFLLISAATVFFTFDLARRASSLPLALLLTFAFLPLMAVRSEIRPEAFTYLLSIFFVWLLFRYRRGEIGARALWLIPLIELFWVNTHIGFIFGPFVIGIYMLAEMFENRKIFFPRFQSFFSVFAATYAVTLLNPSGLTGALYPLRIFESYGYRLLENQSIPFLETAEINTAYDFLLFKVAALLFVVLALLAILRRRFPEPAIGALAAVFGGLAFLGVRHFPSFAIFVIPALAALSSRVGREADRHPWIKKALAAGLCVLLIFGLARSGILLSLRQSLVGIGLVPGVERAGEFLVANAIGGPIFNNYDIGSYLEYYLAPRVKVFVDNRPEAYSVDFFQKTYIPAQENPAEFEKLFQKTPFNAIIFNYRDLTPWAQQFLRRMVEEKRFAPVFADDRIIIWLRRTEENKALITRSEVPRHFFVTQ